ncbi:hypothetical protein HAZT_HAZT011412 [Hyalella azteca]|uniref:Protein sleepless n=1 Tax=Hyalella azteca TaxID=294128 RepID=A0A6A0GXP2_HYAAZ|nr:hypothetical protein HAZT_HAZT011412 [Hyalella azteca]
MPECAALLCYQCSTLKSQFCGVSLPQHVHDPKNKSDYALWAHQAEPCDHVYSARYCIKTTGIYGGVLGTSRFCSSKDFGNYCELVTRPGDERQYYACVYTCSGNACNPASIKKLSVLLLLMSVLLVASH